MDDAIPIIEDVGVGELGSVSRVDKDTLSRALELARALSEARKRDRLRREYWVRGSVGFPHPWQERFHDLGSSSTERAIIAGNRVGKTRTIAAEVAMHLTGMYPPWWRGRVFRSPVRVWVGSETNAESRDIVQSALFGVTLTAEGMPDGTGWVPGSRIVECGYRSCGIQGVLDTVRVSHVSGGCSEVTFKTYEQGEAKWQGSACDVVWFDEEPSQEIYTEGMTRVLDRKGMVLFSRTPLYGMSWVVRHYMEGGPGIAMVTAAWDDAPHLDEGERRRLMLSYPEHERAARTKGVPMLGSGAVYPVEDEALWCEPFEIPGYFRRIAGIDFGMNHPTAVVWLAHDPDSDTLYVYDCYSKTDAKIAVHAAAILARGDWIPVAWPHDGQKRDHGSGHTLAEQYRALKVSGMLSFSARYEDVKGGGQPREPVIAEVMHRMTTGRFKVFRGREDWMAEKRLYHRKDGVVVDECDDLMSATHYAVMMRRFARSRDSLGRPRQTLAAGLYSSPFQGIV